MIPDKTTISAVMVTRKELSQLLTSKFGFEISPEMIRRNETKWGISKTKLTLNKRVIRYNYQMALDLISNVVKSL